MGPFFDLIGNFEIGGSRVLGRRLAGRPNFPNMTSGGGGGGDSSGWDAPETMPPSPIFHFSKHDLYFEFFDFEVERFFLTNGGGGGDTSLRIHGLRAG